MEIEIVNKSFPTKTKKKSGSNSFSIKFYQNFKEELISILPRLFYPIGTK